MQVIENIYSTRILVPTVKSVRFQTLERIFFSGAHAEKIVYAALG